VAVVKKERLLSKRRRKKNTGKFEKKKLFAWKNTPMNPPPGGTPRKKPPMGGKKLNGEKITKKITLIRTKRDYKAKKLQRGLYNIAHKVRPLKAQEKKFNPSPGEILVELGQKVKGERFLKRSKMWPREN